MVQDFEGNDCGGLPGPAFCLALGGERVFVGLRDRVAVLDRDGGLLATWEGLGERAWLTSITVRGDDVLVADAGQRLVWRFDITGRLRGQFGRRDPAAGEEGFVVPSPFFDLAFGPTGELWVVNPGGHRVQRRSLEGRILASWGETSLNPEGFSGCCNPSRLALLADGTFATSGKGIPRVTRHGRDGRLQLRRLHHRAEEGPDLPVELIGIAQSRLRGEGMPNFQASLQSSEMILKYHFMKTALVTSLKRKATDIITQVAESRDPVLITQHGRPAAYLVDVETFKGLNEKLAILEGIGRGERAIEEVNTLTQRKAKEKLSKWLR